MTLLPGLVAVGSLLGLTLPDRAQPTGTRTASLTFFTDRAGFVTQFPALPLEDFEQGSAPFGGVRNCPGPLDATSDNACVAPGAIKPGVRFNSEQPNFGMELAFLGRGLFQAPSQRIVSTNWRQAFVIDFTGGDVKTAGMDLVVPVGAGTCQIDIFGANGLLGSTTAPCTNQGAFWGVTSDQPITRIRISCPDASEGVDNVSFGAGGIPVDPVAVDIKPGSDRNPINLYARGVIPVAVLSTRIAAGAARDFDAGQIDAGTVAFGPGHAPAAHGGHLEDVNGDGLADMVFQFGSEASDLSCGDVGATLTGSTLSGRRFSGADAVEMIDCGRRP